MYLSSDDILELNFRSKTGYEYIGVDENGRATFFMLKPKLITTYGNDKEFWYIVKDDYPSVHIVRHYHYTVAEVGTFEGLECKTLYMIDELLNG